MVKKHRLVHVALLMAPLWMASTPMVAQQAAPPNIILIVADDMGYGDAGCYGQEKIKTPHIDALAAEGMRFTQFYAGTSVCAPSRASLLTGMHTGHTDVRGNRRFLPEGQYPLPEGTVTLPTLLQRAGYHTAAFGKWGLGFPESSGIPQRQGFHHFYGYLCQTLAHNYYPLHLWNDRQKIELPGNARYDSLYAADHLQQKALDYINRSNGQPPFFLYLPYTLPHARLQIPRDEVYWAYVKEFGEKPLPQPAQLKPGERFEPYPHAAYAAMMSRLDSYVGQLVAALKAKGVDDNTLILFTSDNGPHAEDLNDPKYFRSSGGLRGIKRDLYEGGIRVPLIVRWPGKVEAGITTDHVAAFWDIMPTLLQAAGAAVPAGMDGLSFLPALLQDDAQEKHAFLYWEFHENNGRQALRMANWKLVKYNVGLPEPGTAELYDLLTDEGEKVNVATKYPAILADMERILAREHRPHADWPLLHAGAGKAAAAVQQ